MYTANDLKNLKTNPRINDIETTILQEFYELYLMPFIFNYNITYKDGNKETIKLMFNKENFCHLIGIESIVKYSVRNSDLYNYKGEYGWNNIKLRNITFNKLKRINRNKFKSIKAKFVFFYLIPHILENPIIVNFDKTKVNPPTTNIDCKILFYCNEQNAIIHLGISKSGIFYFPKTFFVEKINQNNNFQDIYTMNQEKITLENKEKVILL